MANLSHVPVEGMNWVCAVVAAEKDEKSFVDKHMADVGTYKDFSPEKKTAVLKLAYKLSCENAPESVPSKGGGK